MLRDATRFLRSLLAIAFAAGLASPAGASDDAVPMRKFLAKYCIDCHGPRKQKGDRRFDELTLPVSKTDALIDLKDVLDQINLGAMPPETATQPTAEERNAFVEQTSRALAAGREKLAGVGGRTVLRRLNRREYLNTVVDLFALKGASFDPTTKFPRDQTLEQMDNLGDVLRTSGYLLDQYIDAADAVVDKVFALRKPHPEQKWRFTGDFRFKSWNEARRKEYDNAHLLILECMHPDKHVGSFAVVNAFKSGVPADGIYEIKVLANALNRRHQYDPEIFSLDPREPFRLGVVPGDAKLGPLDLPQPQQPLLAEASLDDDDPDWHTLTVWLDAGQTPRFVFPNGPKNARSAWRKMARYHKDEWPQREIDRGDIGIVEAEDLALRLRKFPHIRIDEVKIRGPIVEEWPPVSQKLALGRPTFDPDRLREHLRYFADRAYRRPATADEVDRLTAVAEKRGRAAKSPFEGYKAALKAALCSPSFLYLSQDTIPASDSKARPRLNGYALASRLSYFLWSSPPDEELLRLAKSDELTKPDVLVAQTRRLLADPRSNAFTADFLDAWLNLRSLGATPPDRKEFESYYYKGLEHAFKEEARLFMRDLIDRDGSIVDFLDSKHTFVNQALATHYGFGDLKGDAPAHAFRRIEFADPRRGGLLGMGAVLTVTANGIETSP
ncbi:MAG: DUF1592 domain-containing protein, partial [Planctomycetia bacterium]